MAVSPLEAHCEVQTDRHPLLMEQPVVYNTEEHVIDINASTRGGAASLSSSHEDHNSNHDDTANHNAGTSNSTQIPTPQSSSPSSTAVNSRNTTGRRRVDGHGRRHRSPLNSGLWISIEFVITVGQIVSSIVVLSLARDENPRTPLFLWIVGYALGCFATLPILCWRYLHRNGQGTEQQAMNSHQESSGNNLSSGPTYTSMSSPRAPEEEDHNTTGITSSNSQSTGTEASSSRLNALVDHFKMALDCFFAVWFVVGNVWIFGGHNSSSSAPKLYSLCIVFLTFSCIGYAMPFILCATICCCLPCIISVLGIREDLGHTRGATPEAIGALPTYKFKSKRNRNRQGSEINMEGANQGGILAPGTDKERAISAEDAVCCICLARYVDNEELRELPCAHFFHKECVDKWLEINASCPLCKSEIRESGSSSESTTNNRWQVDRRGSGSEAIEDAYGSNVL